MKKENIDEKLVKLSKYVRTRNEADAIKDIEIARKHAYEYKKQRETKKFGRNLRHVADIPASLFFLLPKEIQQDKQAMNDWLEKYGKEFKLVDKL